MAENKIPSLEVEGVKLIYRNFSGAPSQYNADGDRNFCFIIEDEKQAKELQKDGWNVKIRETEDGTFSFMKVKVNLNSSYPPKIKMIIGENMIITFIILFISNMITAYTSYYILTHKKLMNDRLGLFLTLTITFLFIL